jgi:hypothetical protein
MIITVAFGHVDPDLDDDGRDQYLDLAAAELVHNLLFGRRLHLAVQESDAAVGQLARAQPLELLGRARRFDATGSLDEGTDDVGAVALGHLSSH